MRFLASLSVISGAIALACLLAFTFAVPELRSSIFHLRLPLDLSDPEAAAAFAPSLLFGSLALLLGAPAFRRRLARTGLLLGAGTWLGVFCLIGSSGFQILF